MADVTDQTPGGAAPSADEPRPPLSRRKRIAFAAITLLLPLLAAEVAARILYRPVYVFVDDADGLDFRYAPNAQFGGVTLSDRGFNEQSRPLRKPAGTRRIVALGDSFTYGVTPRELTIPSLLEARLRELRGEGAAPVEVHNLGVNAYGTDQEVVLLRREALLRDPDVAIIFFYVGNDVRDNARRDDRRVVNGKLVRGSQAHIWRRLTRSSALYRFIDDRGGLFVGGPAAPAGLPKHLIDRANARAAQQRGLIAEVAKVNPEARQPLVDRAVAVAREAAMDTELIDQRPEEQWLPREEAVVAAAEQSVREALDAEKDPAEAAKALGEAFIALEEKATRERHLAGLGREWIGIHLRFADTYRPGHERDKFERGWSETERILGEAAAVCREAGVALRVVVLPSEVQVDEWARAEMLRLAEAAGMAPATFDFDWPQRKMAEICARIDVPMLDVLQACRERDREVRLYHKSNAHFTAEGNRIVAERVAEWLGDAIPR